jgi:hypothetical protein
VKPRRPQSPAMQDYSFVSLEAVSYERSISASNVQVPVNTANYSGTNPAGVFRPSADIDAWEGGFWVAACVRAPCALAADPGHAGEPA